MIHVEVVEVLGKTIPELNAQSGDVPAGSLFVISDPTTGAMKRITTQQAVGLMSTYLAALPGFGNGRALVSNGTSFTWETISSSGEPTGSGTIIHLSAGQGSYTFTANRLISKIQVNEPTPITLTIGTVEGGSQIADSISLNGGTATIDVGGESFSNGDTIYFSGITGNTQINLYVE